MTDFVSRLLGIASASTPPIRPLIGSLFEPQQLRQPEEEPLPMGDVTGHNAPPWPVGAPEALRSAASAGPETVTRQPESPIGRVAGHEVVPPAPRPAPARLDVGDEPPTPRKRDTADIGDVAPVRPQGAEIVPLAAHRPLGQPTETSAVEPQGDHRPAVVTRRDVDAATKPVREHPVRPLHTVVRPAVAIPGAPWPASRRERAAEPSVHITIGRVEVKATQETSAPQRKQSDRRPAMSLDDYLRTRSGGDRR
ncbi:hypothetical protein ABZ468_37435 [Streptomyces sp. NPDC005708]|uniref:hypothetical protein n=1 Tax=Streptomyces sp. NPDC005708 TaxID=3154564 RepID=UPI0033C29CF7